MRLAEDPPVDLTYCLNIHRGETWAENFEAIATKTRAIRDRFCPGERFGLGLRLSARAAATLSVSAERERFAEWVARNQMYVFTINGFPYGPFHGEPVKENVYRPDWRERERLEYTVRLADILAGLVPPEASGSISTVPGSYRAWIGTAADRAAMVDNLVAAVDHLRRLHGVTGRLIHLGLEPEPDCFLETTDDVISFFRDDLYGEGAHRLAHAMGASADAARAVLRRHLGVCFDTCHLALQAEDLVASLDRLSAEGILVSKVQISAALRTATPAGRAGLSRFADSVYLHQVKAVSEDGCVRSLGDLPDALASAESDAPREDDEWRVHCHVPLYAEGVGDIRSTADALTPEFFAKALAVGVAHFEVETYTFDVLPPELTARGVEASIVEELGWARRRLANACGLPESGA